MAGRTMLISEHFEDTMEVSSATHWGERYTITPAHPSIVTMGVEPVICRAARTRSRRHAHRDTCASACTPFARAHASSRG